MAPSRQGPTWSQRLLWVLSLCLGLVSPAQVWADLYGWVDDRGVQHIVDDPTRIPGRFRSQARLFMTSSASRGTESPATGSGQAPSTGLPRAESSGSGRGPNVERPAVSDSAELTVDASVEPSAVSPVEPLPPETQGSVAVALAERLALAHRPTPVQAVNALLERGILPPAGWMLDEPIDPGWIADLARSLLTASSAGRLQQTPETALRTLEGVAAERGIAVVAFEPPPPPQPQVITTQPATVIVETVYVPAFPLHTGSYFHHSHFRQKSFKDQPRFPKSTCAGQHQPQGLHPRTTAADKITEFPPVRSHGVQGGSTMLTAGPSTSSGQVRSTGASMRLRPETSTSSVEPLRPSGSAEPLSTGIREKRSGATRCTSSGIGHSVRICP